MYGSHSSIISRKEIKKFSQRRSAFVVQKAICLVIVITTITISITGIITSFFIIKFSQKMTVMTQVIFLILGIVLVWLRIDWGTTDWAHRVFTKSTF